MQKLIVSTIALLGSLLMASCGGVSPAREQRAQEVSAPVMVTVSTQGQQALNLLRSAAPASLTENVYLNALTLETVPADLNERSGPGGTRWVTRWANTKWQDLNNTLVKVNWLRAYAVTGEPSAAALRDACLRDGAGAEACAQALQGATNAAVEYRAGTWLLVLAHLERPVTLSPQH